MQSGPLVEISPMSNYSNLIWDTALMARLLTPAHTLNKWLFEIVRVNAVITNFDERLAHFHEGAPQCEEKSPIFPPQAVISNEVRDLLTIPNNLINHFMNKPLYNDVVT